MQTSDVIFLSHKGILLLNNSNSFAVEICKTCSRLPCCFAKLTARELDLKQDQMPYEKRDHALFTAFAPFNDPRYAISVIIEHGGCGSSGAAPLAKGVIKRLIDNHPMRLKYTNLRESLV